MCVCDIQCMCICMCNRANIPLQVYVVCVICGCVYVFVRVYVCVIRPTSNTPECRYMCMYVYGDPTSSIAEASTHTHTHTHMLYLPQEYGCWALRHLALDAECKAIILREQGPAMIRACMAVRHCFYVLCTRCPKILLLSYVCMVSCACCSCFCRKCRIFFSNLCVDIYIYTYIYVYIYIYIYAHTHILSHM